MFFPGEENRLKFEKLIKKVTFSFENISPSVKFGIVKFGLTL